MQNRIIWITDPHMPHLDHDDRERWFNGIANHDGYFFITGDFGSAVSTPKILKRIESLAKNKVFVVLGNHDFYGSTITAVRHSLNHEGYGIQTVDGADKMICYEPGMYQFPYQLDEHTWVAGTGGCGDSNSGTCDPKSFELNDEEFIRELFLARVAGRLKVTLQDLGTEHAEYLLDLCAKVPEDAKNLLLIAHVPPWTRSAWHQGHMSDDYALPRFCWHQGGVAIDLVAQERPDLNIQVFCGHTHSGGRYAHDKVECHTGGAHYCHPHLNGYIDLRGEQLPLVTRMDGTIIHDGSLMNKPTKFPTVIPRA